MQMIHAIQVLAGPVLAQPQPFGLYIAEVTQLVGFPSVSMGSSFRIGWL